MFRQTFKTLSSVNLEILYPCYSDAVKRNADIEYDSSELKELAPNLKPGFFLSINRYERKKNVALAIQALGKSC